MLIRVALPAGIAAGIAATGAALLLAGPAAAAGSSPSASPSATLPYTVATPTAAAPTSLLTEVPEPVETGGISVPAGNAYSTQQHGASATDLAALLAAGVALAGGGTALVLRRRS